MYILFFEVLEGLAGSIIYHGGVGVLSAGVLEQMKCSMESAIDMLKRLIKRTIFLTKVTRYIPIVPYVGIVNSPPQATLWGMRSLIPPCATLLKERLR